MKRILMGLISLFCVMIALAQTHDVRGRFLIENMNR